MKWYNKENTKRYKEDIVYSPVPGGPVFNEFLKWMPKIATTINREYASIGTLDLNDLIQICNYHLIVAWENFDWSRIDNVHENHKQATVWKYVKKSVTFELRREINLYKDSMRSVRKGDPARKISIKGKTAEDSFLTELFPDFFNEQFFGFVEDVDTSWDTEMQAKGLDHLMREALTLKEKHIVEMVYGIDCEKLSQKEIAKIFHTTVSNIQNIKHRAIKKLKNHDNNIKIIEYYYDNF